LHRSGIFRSSVLVGFVNYAGIPLLMIYTFAMFIYPWFEEKGNWQNVQLVWERWQTLNAGAFAFLASLIAFNISKFNENQQREREFIAAKAFLPSTLDALIDYYTQSAQIYCHAWNKKSTTECLPALPIDYREVFSNCIRHADPIVGKYLSNILVNLQVHDARLRDILKSNSTFSNRPNLISCFYRIAELYALTSNLFEFARGREAFNNQTLSLTDIDNAYGILKISVEEIAVNEELNLASYSRRALTRDSDSFYNENNA
jgi:hypothetical protein